MTSKLYYCFALLMGASLVCIVVALIAEIILRERANLGAGYSCNKMAASYSRDGGEGCTQTRMGCKIENGQCVCGVGCYYEYRYNSKSECYKAIKSRESDLCQRKPCKNGGTCSQTSHEPGFKCRCEGTGFYGQRCQYGCPKVGAPLQGAFPYECIVI